MKISSKLLTGIAAMALSLYAQAYPGESIVLDPVTGDYTITYRGDPDSIELSQAVFVPSTKIAPAIRSHFRQDERGMIVYRYTVSNGATAKQAIVSVLLDQIVNHIVGELSFPDDPVSQTVVDTYNAATETALASPPTWDGDITRYRIATHGEDLDRIAWMPKSDDLNAGGIQAGRTLTGFGFSSPDLPGIGPSLTSGFGDVLGFPDEGPVEDSAVFAEVDRLQRNDFIVRNAAVPTITIPDPFDPAVTLERIQAHMHTWIAKQLIEPAFAAQLDSHFKTAADVYRKQGSAGNGQVGRMFALLVQQYEGLERGDEELVKKKSAVPAQIDKLAALVLYFDLKYVMRRMGGGN